LWSLGEILHVNLLHLFVTDADALWSRLQKLRRCNVRKDREKLSGRVEVRRVFRRVRLHVALDCSAYSLILTRSRNTSHLGFVENRV